MEDLSQYLDEFLADARDRIDSLSNAILTLEKIVKEGGSEEEKKAMIDQIFRDAHTLKGTAATMGFMKLSEVAHKMENLFDLVRSGKIEPTPELIDVLLEFLDIIEAMVDNIEETGEEGDFDVDSLFEKAQKFFDQAGAGGGKKEEEKEEKEEKAPEEGEGEEAEAPEAPPAGNRYLVKVYFQKDAPLRGVRAFLILSDLEELGVVVETNPERKVIEDGKADVDVLEFVIETEEDPEKIKTVVSRHPEVEKVEVQTLGGETVASGEGRGEGGERKYEVTVYLQKDAPLKGVRSYLVLQDLQKVGVVEKTEPNAIDIQNGELIDGYYFRVILRTNLNKEDIVKIITKHPDVENADVREIGEEAPAQAQPKPEKKEEKKAEKAEKKEKKAAKGPIKTPKVKISKIIKVDVSHLDRLMNLVGELVITKGRLEQIAERLGDRELLETLSTLSRLLTELQDEIMEMRLTPVAEVFNKFPRMVRELARKMGKEVEFIIEGADIEVDRTILDKLGDVLVHLLRNAIDHGIEPPEEREKLGKPRAGRLELIARRERSHVEIIVRDDGRGIDPEKIKRKAIEKGLITPEQAAEMSDEEAINLIFLPGFSTKDQVTDVSGRGVGMDVVKEVVKSLNGSIAVYSEVGKGTTFVLKLPVSMAIIQALLIKVQDEVYAVPINNILESIEIKRENLKSIGGKEVIVLRGEIIPVIMLHELFGLPMPELEEFPALVVDLGAQKVAIGVDELLHKKDIVIKSLGKMLSHISGFAGATILGDGSVVLIIEINGLLGGGRGGI
ncbi:chemotaxis protein CheW [Thermococcus nautili]|uniref:Chemotaxis protein CheA n=1 Tax=Thermococcus nautili TaxID=195522 RepID=W8PL65_9EURY|nr:chemotaxis protein CheW [Thermococcus nautili]AHL22779.1 Chemotaxis protein histidine kinase-related kinase [Thermococcus nautili]CAI1493172.1 Signal transduction histidine kinase CheA [Thermococcus nautili]